ncbi:MAG: DUF2058 family protein [Lysobacterales bacterium]
MSESLRDQLLKSGLVKKLKSEPRPGAAKAPAPGRPRAAPGKVARAAVGEPDLAQAWAQRARLEREERERAQREAEQRAREKRERRARLHALLDGKSLNAADAEHPRHFPHGGKIRRIYCTAEQLAALNRGELGVVQRDGRYLLVSRDVAEQAGVVAAEALVLLVDPDAPADDDVPADLTW